MDFFKRKYFSTAALLTLLFILLTKAIPFLFIWQKLLYDQKGISMKAVALANILSWPFSALFPSSFVNSYYFLPLVFLYYLLLLIVLGTVHTFLKNKKLYKWLLLVILLPFTFLRIWPNLLVKLDNDRPSHCQGSPGHGLLQNGKRLFFHGPNFEYFNFLSYLKGNAFVHGTVRQTLVDAYKTCETTCPDILFYTGEGSKENGGPYVFNHRTHQNGTSLDLMLVFKKEKVQYVPLSPFNAYGYGINTDDQGKINKSIPVNWHTKNAEIDFETNAKFLLALDDACRKNGIRIKIVILKVSLKPLLFACPSGKKLLARNLRFANALPEFINLAHDDHFHVDFEVEQ